MMKKKGYAKGGVKKVITAKAGRTIGKTAAAHRTANKMLKSPGLTFDDPRMSDQDKQIAKNIIRKKKISPRDPRMSIQDMKIFLNTLKNDSRVSDQDIKAVNRIIGKTKKK